jgi:hypothetical protein
MYISLQAPPQSLSRPCLGCYRLPTFPISHTESRQSRSTSAPTRTVIENTDASRTYDDTTEAPTYATRPTNAGTRPADERDEASRGATRGMIMRGKCTGPWRSTRLSGFETAVMMWSIQGDMQYIWTTPVLIIPMNGVRPCNGLSKGVPGKQPSGGAWHTVCKSWIFERSRASIPMNGASLLRTPESFLLSFVFRIFDSIFARFLVADDCLHVTLVCKAQESCH